MIKKGINLLNSNILIMGLTFKENSTDLRNTGVASMIAEFKSFHCNVDVFDPKADKREALEEYNIELVDKPAIGKYEAIVFAVAHDEFKQLSINYFRAKIIMKLFIQKDVYVPDYEGDKSKFAVCSIFL